METWDNIIDERLVSVYGVDDDSLKLNRRGRMTPTQKQLLKQFRNRRFMILSRTLIIVLVLFFVMGFISVTGIFGAVLGILRGLILLMAAGQAIRLLHFHVRAGQEISSGTVLMYPGRLNKVVWNGIRILFCERGAFYNLSNQEWDAFDHYGRYRVYSTPYTGIIIGAQPVHRDEPLPEAWRRKDD